jgi:ADP-ribose pyrophosphatase YjhB (NUDIX family)
VILRNDGHILLVKERSGPAAVSSIWKLPTGLVEPTENLGEAAVREAKEETCIDCEFDSIICFRHSHGGSPSLGASSDLFFTCLLRMKDDSQQTCLQESEILDSLWVHYTGIHEATKCAEGTAARELMNRVVHVLSQRHPHVIQSEKLPAWRRKNCYQWIYYPHILNRYKQT